MEEDKEELKELILDELKRLGMQEAVSKKKNGAAQGARFLGINTASNSNGVASKNKVKNKRSPRISRSRSPRSKLNSNRARDERKYTPKSPFSSSKRKAELRKQNTKGLPSCQIFGQKLESIPCVCVYMTDGTQVTVPELLVDLCNLIRRNINIEGIFRKAGSSQRQNDLKKLIDSNNSLPLNVHVIDAACLLKQFLRCLPEPILPSEVHCKILRCMELSEEARVEAVTLCTFLLPRAHRHTLVYLMDLMTEVAASSAHNLMDAHNLAIVLAPNLLPTTFTSTNSRKSATPNLHSEDALLTTNIEIMQLMIENVGKLCRIPNSLSLALDIREKSRSTENLLSSQQQSSARKKRRSASIHRLMTGLRRVVGHSNSSGSPLRATDSVEHLDSLHLHPGVALSPSPLLDIVPRKRKSADAFDMSIEAQKEAVEDAYLNITPPSNKRVKVENEVGTTDVCPTTAATSMSKNLENASPVVSDCLPLPNKSSVTVGEKQSAKVGRSITIREVKNSWDVFSKSNSGSSQSGNLKTDLSRSLSTKIRAFSKSPSCGPDRPHSSVKCQSANRMEPIGHTNTILSLPRAQSQVFESTPVKRPATIKRRSCDVPITGGVKRAGNFDEPVRVTRRSSSDWRLNSNEPDGADVSTLGPRGVPDGAECNLRDVFPKHTLKNSLETLEQQYDDVKAIVKTMEAEVDKNNVQQMKELLFSNNSSSSQNMSYSEMIQNAYERMKVESKDLGSSPSESLTRRLDKELKIRNRKSSEHKVIRSPSERKIGTIRRRSKELIQNAAKSLISMDDTPGKKQQETPRMKEYLIQTPVNVSLRRGKPNTVKSGLPIVLHSVSPMQNEESSSKNTSRTVVVSKRIDSKVIHPLKVTKRSPCFSVSSSETSMISDADLKESLSKISVGNMDISAQSIDGNLMDSILELVPGAVTRRRSSLLSPLSLSFQRLNRRSSGSNDSLISVKKTPNYRFGYKADGSPHWVAEDDEAKSRERSAENMNESAVTALPAIILSESDESEQWIPASEFQYNESELYPGNSSNGNGRPSLAALIKQKKVTANVQLFNSLHSVTPSRRQTNAHLCRTPKQAMPDRSTASEHRNARVKYSKSLSTRTNLTPKERLKTRQRSFQFDRTPNNITKIAVVSPLKESTWINVQREHSHEVAKAFKGEATIPQPSTFTENHCKPPLPSVTPVQSQKHKNASNKFDTPNAVPPKLPPRGCFKASPLRIQYR